MASNDPNIKTIKIINRASHEEPMEGGDEPAKPKRVSTRKKKFVIQSVTVQKEGGGQHPGVIDQLASTHVPGSDDSKAMGLSSSLTDKLAPVGPIAPSLGGAQQRVILAKTKKKSSVILAGPKAHSPESKHKKTVKKLNVNLKGLTRKVRKAKKIENNITDTSLENVKSALVKAGLIKSETKAPEAILRRMYSDFMVLKKRAL